MCIILSNSKRGQTPMLISYAMKEALLTKKKLEGEIVLLCGLCWGNNNESVASRKQ